MRAEPSTANQRNQTMLEVLGYLWLLQRHPAGEQTAEIMIKLKRLIERWLELW